MRRLVVTCALVALWGSSGATAQSYPNDFRVSPGFGDRAGSTVRLTYTTLQTDRDAEFESFFDYNGQFEYRWTNFRAHSKLISVQPGTTTEVNVPNSAAFNVTLPRPGEGVRGIMTADVCFSSDIATCDTGTHDQILARMPALLNSIISHSQISYWSMIGDNFYDGSGSTSRLFFSMLSVAAKAKFFFAAVGNYDMWDSGTDKDINVPKDQFGNGFMQYYGGDTLAAFSAAGSSAPWNFTVDPDTAPPPTPSPAPPSQRQRVVQPQAFPKKQVGDPARRKYHRHDDEPAVPEIGSVENSQYLPAVENFEYVTQVGNLAFIGFSGAHHHSDTEPFLQYACNWINGQAGVDWIVLLGHWSQSTKGASDKSTTQAVADDLAGYGCDASKVVYFMGHTHCNMIHEPNKGFIVGGFGKADNHCSQFGIPYVDSSNGRFLVVYFPISEKLVPNETDSEEEIEAVLKGATERYQALQACVDSYAIGDCLQLEHQVWMNVSVASRQASVRY
jgi:hypothetical protein